MEEIKDSVRNSLINYSDKHIPEEEHYGRKALIISGDILLSVINRNGDTYSSQKGHIRFLFQRYSSPILVAIANNLENPYRAAI